MSTNKPLFTSSSKDFLLALAKEKTTFTNPELFDRNLADLVLSFVKEYDYAGMRAAFLPMNKQICAAFSSTKRVNFSLKMEQERIARPLAWYERVEFIMDRVDQPLYQLLLKDPRRSSC